MSGGEEDVIEVTVDMSELKKMKVPELKRKVAELGLPTKGTKVELLVRVEKYLHEQEEEEELLEDDEVADEVVEEGEEEERGEGVEGNVEENDVTEDVPAPTATTTNKVEEKDNKTEVKDDENDSTKPKQTVPISAAGGGKVGSTPAECLAQRAARFGGNSSETAKKIARAERFGTTLENEFKGLGKRATPTEEDLGKMKKRAMRFGSSVSPAITSAEEDGKKKKRLERFGQKATDLSAEERKKMREAKFAPPIQA